MSLIVQYCTELWELTKLQYMDDHGNVGNSNCEWWTGRHHSLMHCRRTMLACSFKSPASSLHWVRQKPQLAAVLGRRTPARTLRPQQRTLNSALRMNAPCGSKRPASSVQPAGQLLHCLSYIMLLAGQSFALAFWKGLSIAFSRWYTFEFFVDDHCCSLRLQLV